MNFGVLDNLHAVIHTVINRKRDLLINHIATTKDYLNVYRRVGPIAEQMNLFKQYTHYIISRCWKKMYCRLTPWSLQGYLYFLGMVSQDILEKSFQQFFSRLTTRSTWKDTALSATLENDAWVEEVMQGYPPGPNLEAPILQDLRLTKLRAALKNSKPPMEMAYNADTCVEFHQLLVMALVGYGKALRLFSEASAQAKAHMTNLRDPAHHLWHFTHLLWRIAYSQMLCYHLAALVVGNAIYIPIDPQSMKDLYSAYAQATGIVVKPDQRQKLGLCEVDNDLCEVDNDLPDVDIGLQGETDELEDMQHYIDKECQASIFH